jgi:hypothetical protein
MRLVTSDTIPDRVIELGDIVYACAVSGANILREIRGALGQDNCPGPRRAVGARTGEGL